ncbi:MAG: DUF4860 domain-containing protein [Oscillibacter sp.]|nr:DUF4860 domain-containing protein [Oscillibacter sp.]
MRRTSGIGAAAAGLTACIFGAALLLSLVTGAGVYRQVESRVERSAVRRVGLSYLAAKVHAHDVAGAVRVGQFGDGDALFLTETASETDSGDVYETVVYVYDGFLMELFRVRGAAMEPETGQRIADMRSLEAEADGALLRLRVTDADGVRETADVYVRSGT